jgi:hypothetical protein
LAGASALILGAGDRVLAGEATGMDIKVIKEAASMIPGFPKVRLRQATYQAQHVMPLFFSPPLYPR